MLDLDQPLLDELSRKKLMNIRRIRQWTGTLAVSALSIFSIGIVSQMDVQAAPNATNQARKTPTSANSSKQIEENIRKQLALKLDNVSITSVQKTPFNDLYEVVINNREVVYTNANTDFTLIGHLINNTDMNNLTQAKLDELSIIDFKSLPLKQSFALVKGTGERHIAVFEDPNCGYCKQFRKTLETVDNITIHTFVIDILGPKSTEMAKRLLCEADVANAWDMWMRERKEPTQAGTCDTSVLVANVALANKLGVSGTPTVFFSNGKRAPGAIDRQTLLSMLDQAK